MNEHVRWHHDLVGERVAEALRRNDFDAVYCKSAPEAAEEILRLVPETGTVGLGGSWTVKELGVVEKLKARGTVILDHGAQGLENDERVRIRRAQLTADVFLTGSNAVTMDCLFVERVLLRTERGLREIGPRQSRSIARGTPRREAGQPASN